MNLLQNLEDVDLTTLLEAFSQPWASSLRVLSQPLASFRLRPLAPLL
ncbi:hypothetical protein Hanom_Chr12g01121031 [Helianthus anomalus]